MSEGSAGQEDEADGEVAECVGVPASECLFRLAWRGREILMFGFWGACREVRDEGGEVGAGWEGACLA